MRATPSIAMGLLALLLLVAGGQSASAWEQVSLDGYRSNFVYRFGAPRPTYRLFGYRMHDQLPSGPRYMFRLRREGFDLQRGQRWAPTVVEAKDTLK